MQHSDSPLSIMPTRQAHILNRKLVRALWKVCPCIEGEKQSAKHIRRPAWESCLWPLNQWKVLRFQCLLSKSNRRLNASRGLPLLRVLAFFSDGEDLCREHLSFGELQWGSQEWGDHSDAPPWTHMWIPLLVSSHRGRISEPWQDRQKSGWPLSLHCRP